MAGVTVQSPRRADTPSRASNGSIPRLTGDIRHLVPKLGLRNYWYPAIGAKRVGKRNPVQLTMLGDVVCLFRGTDGDVAAIQDVCPHRGALFSEGTCHWQGTVTCPYHGWVYDEHGKNVAVLGEGPDSSVQGKVGTEARVYPTRTLKGVVFIWMGEEDPAPIEEDVPEEFFDPDTRIFFNDRIYWKTNWEVGLENSMDSHVNYLHRDHLQAMLGNTLYMPRGASGSKVAFTGNGFKSLTETPENPPQDIYPQLGWKWPKRRLRKFWAWIFNPFFKATSVPPSPTRSERWSMGHRLPGMFRAGVAPTGSTARVPRPRGGGLFGLYTRWTVPVEDWLTRVWYFHSTRPSNPIASGWYWLLYWTNYRWLVEYNFSQQDMSVMENQRYDWPEKLSGTDAEVVQWRRLVVTKHFGGRNAEFDHSLPVVSDEAGSGESKIA